MNKGFKNLALQEYRRVICLDQRYEIKNFQPLTIVEREKVVNYIVDALQEEDDRHIGQLEPLDYLGKRCLLRKLLNTRRPKPMDEEVLYQLNRLLRTEVLEKGIVKATSLKTIAEIVAHRTTSEEKGRLVLWQGDITRLEIDAIVNAANHQMLGCFQPLHACIDNAIHSAAGPQLRDDCHTIMKMQGTAEMTGTAKVTRAYNLPSQYVLHTVGPIVMRGTAVTDQQRFELGSSYTACLEAAKQVERIKTIAFCAISTGVFGFPKQEAAEIAINTVRNWLQENPNRFEKIVFCVFDDTDYQIYYDIFQSKYLDMSL